MHDGASPGRVPLPLPQWTERLKWNSNARDARATIDGVAVAPTVIEEFQPLYRCLESRLADCYWSRAGVLPFAEGEVPFLVNNSGRLSENAALVLFANCVETNPQDIAVIELGAGTGLFARYFLDSFRAICEREQKDYYDRLTYVVTDGSQATIDHWRERDVFAAHPGRVVMQVCDAGRQLPDLARPIQAIFCNYILDVLPTAIVRRGPDGGVEQLCFRTHLNDDPGLLKIYAAPSLDELRALAQSSDTETLARLIPFSSLFDCELAFRADEAAALPYIDWALRSAVDGQHVTLNFGALDCLDRCLERITPGGFVLLSDYGPVKDDAPADLKIAQRFGTTTAIGLNFPVIERYLASRGVHARKAPGDDARALHSRLISTRDTPRTAEAFDDRFSAAAYEHFEAPIRQAREHATAGRKEQAFASYRDAVDRSPRDWAIVGEAAEFVSLQLRDFASARELCRAALELNPIYSSWLWNIMGDVLYCLEHYDEAHEAYLQAERIDPNDVRTNQNLAYTFLRDGRFEDCLRVIARGLAADGRGIYRDRLIEKQQQVIAGIASRWTGENDRLTKRNLRFTSAR
jgi:tetratricopeptide (TPR) repeat protein